MKPKALYVGHPKVGEMLTSAWSQFDWVGSVANISEMFAEIKSGHITNDFHCLFIMDHLFKKDNPNDSSFENTIVRLAPFCFIGIINYLPQNNSALDDRISKAAYYYENEGSVYYYYINKSSPSESLLSAIEQYKRESGNAEITAVLNGEEPPVEPVEEDKSAVFIEQPKSDTLGQVVSVTSSKGGSGKSIVAMSIATYIAHASLASVREGLESRPLKVCIVDFDTEAGHLGFTTGIVKPNITQMRQNGINEESLAATAVPHPGLKCDLLLAPKSARTARDTPASFYDELVSFLRLHYDYVILDTSSKYLDALTAEIAYPRSNQIVFVSDIVMTSIYGMAKWVDELTRPKTRQGLGLPKEKLAIVINKYMGDVNMPADTIQKASQDVKIIGAYPSLPKIVAHAVNVQQVEMLLNNKPWRDATKVVAKAIVGNKYVLSDNVVDVM